MTNKEFINPVDINNPSNVRRTVDLLPGYHKTDKNAKFLASTLDQFIQEPQLERLDGFVGSKLSLNYDPAKDIYLDSNGTLRNSYQLEPSLVIKDPNLNITYSSTYDDLINELKFNGAKVSNLDRLFRPKSFSYDPCIDWDKFINYGQYYWLPNGPDTIEIAGQQASTISSYTVTDSVDGKSLIFTPDGLSTSPLLTLYRGSTYVFDVNSDYPFYIKTGYVPGEVGLYRGATNQGVKQGRLILTIDDTTPDNLFYFPEGNLYGVGQIVVKRAIENSILDVSADIIGKKTYSSIGGVEFSNGMKVRFVGNVMPEEYAENDFIVEGVGTYITLVPYNELKTVGISTTNLNVNFDATPFDQYPFDDFSYVPLLPEYITINRASPDRNSWSRYNRWVHVDVIKATALANGVQPEYSSLQQARRPIVEFVSGLRLYNFGATTKQTVDLIDTITVDALSAFANSPGFYIDQVMVEPGFRVIFNADKDPLTRGKIFEVNFVTVNGKQVVDLVETLDTVSEYNSSLVVLRGETYKGTNWWFNGTEWTYSQQRVALNQFPKFDVFDDDGISFSDQAVYNSTFRGTNVFSYAVDTNNSKDAILNFPLKYKNIANQGDYLFNNDFMTDTFALSVNNQIEDRMVAGNYLKITYADGTESFLDVWTEQSELHIPIIQYQVIDSEIIYVQIIAIDEPGYTPDLEIDLYVNDVKKRRYIDFRIARDSDRAYVVVEKSFSVDDRVLIKLFTKKPSNDHGYYEIPSNLTDNPLNGPIGNFTYAELSDHVRTIAYNSPEFIGVFPGNGNLRDLSNVGKYGSKLVSHSNPVSFAHYFLGTKQHSIIDSVRQVAQDYNQFKSNLLRSITDLRNSYDLFPRDILDLAISSLNLVKDNSVSYNFSDMIAYGKNHSDRSYTVTDSRNKIYSLESIFDNTVLSERSILIYLNDVLLISGRDYIIDRFSASFTIKVPLSSGDIILVSDYSSTVGNFVPPTPTKLGLYPKYTPAKFYDDTYVGDPRLVIQGHDGSITLAFGDYRDDVLLEFEIRVYNNIKTDYKRHLIDINSIIPGAFRTTDYSINEITDIITPDILKWAGNFGVDYQTNNTFDQLDTFTFNYSGMIDGIHKRRMPGHWRAIYKFFYDTDRPHTHPWEMLGFTEKPEWWNTEYGPSPYTRGNTILWNDLESGKIASGDRAGTHSLYSRPGLSNFIPVDDSGNLLSPTDTGLVTTAIINPGDPKRIINIRSINIDSDWIVGDQGPAETSWRKSSYWPFIYQIVAALTKPADYAAFMFDPDRLIANKFNQYKYGKSHQFLNLSKVSLYRDVVNGTRVLASGYSVFVIERGLMNDVKYLTTLKNDLSNITYNLMVKLGGFVSKDKLQISIDSIDPTSPYPGVLLPSEDYQIFFNQSSPIQTLGISGIIVQKTLTGFSVRGYDKYEPYFTVFEPVPVATDRLEVSGGRSENFVNWQANTIYDLDQIVFYMDRYYRSKQKHNSGVDFVMSYYQSLPYLPMTGGISVSTRSLFSDTAKNVPYGTTFETIQEVYDFIIGYERWLVSNGFIFDDFINDLGEISDWTLSAKEFLFWTTQNWTTNSVITLSPFANKLNFYSNTGIVDNILNKFYEYSLLRADGSPFLQNRFTLIRSDGNFTISTVNTTDGIYFAKLNLVQKEHALIFNNYSLFNDVIYDIETGYRQRRVKLQGFRTKNWNGDFFSPGFIFDRATIVDWEKFTSYEIGQVVRFSGNYYSATKSVQGSQSFDLTSWTLLSSKPESTLYPNFDYKINQFEDFYSLDIDNFDAGQQRMAQHLIGYLPRPYLNNIIGNSVAEYKFYQGYIREKGTKNPLIKLSKSTLINDSGSIDFNEEWAFRIGYYGGFNTYQELETLLDPTKFIENPQIIGFVKTIPTDVADSIYYKDINDVIISPDNFDIEQAFPTLTTSTVYTDFEIPVAGYPRFDDISLTAFNKNSILDISNNAALTDGTAIWLGYTESRDWDVLRYTKVATKIIAAEIYISGQETAFVTSRPHLLNTNDIVSITGIAVDVDRCYVVSRIISPTEFTVFSVLFELPVLPDFLGGLLHTFKSSRMSDLNWSATNSLSYDTDRRIGELMWIDNKGDGNWAVYQKIDNFTTVTSVISAPAPDITSQQYGYKIVQNVNTTTIIVSSPTYKETIYGYTGRISVLTRNADSNPRFNFSYSINKDNITYYDGTETSFFGEAVAFDSGISLVIAGASGASSVKSTLTNTVVNPASGISNQFVNQGVVKLSIINENGRRETTATVITTPNPGNNTRFGKSLAYSTQTSKLIVGSPGYANGIGAIYRYTVGVTTSVNVTYSSRTSPSISTGSNFGTNIAANWNNSIVAVTAPGINNTLGSTGAVFVYRENSTTNVLEQLKIISGDSSELPVTFGASDNFGSTIKLTKDGKFLFIGTQNYNDSARGNNTGVVDIFMWTGTNYSFNQRLDSPFEFGKLEFGYDIALDETETELVISTKNSIYSGTTTYDRNSTRLGSTIANSLYGTIYVNDPTSPVRNSTTDFDTGTTTFYDVVYDVGTVHVYYKYGEFWTYAQELPSSSVNLGSSFGSGLSVTSKTICVGAPSLLSSYNQGRGQVYIYDRKEVSVNAWKLLRQNSPLVDLTLVKKASTIDSNTQQVKDYLDIIDPVKGDILATAKQELKFITPYDPAIYSIGIDSTNVDTNSNWLDEHVGELWWDLSNVKFVWYEQGELEYRKNNWNRLFPGCTIDVYEWVKSEFLPIEWSTFADTADGLARGISGQPKFATNTVMSVKQVYNSVSNSFSNVYYYWVKNKNILPDNVHNRKLTAFSVASQIVDPVGSGIKSIAILGPTSAMISNIKPALMSNNVNLNITFDYTRNSANRHTEWLLLQENDPNSKPNALLEKKLIDSLIGHDEIGNAVPFPNLPEKVRYGLGIRPQQSLFKYPLEAMRNIMEFSNTILSSLLITDKINFGNLESKDQIPSTASYDLLVEDIYALELVNVKSIKSADIRPIIDLNGKISSVVIVDPGSDYRVSPTLVITGDGTGAEIIVPEKDGIDETGGVVRVSIINPGSQYTYATITVRPFTVVVQTDSTVNGKWAVYEWDVERQRWNKSRTQEYDTTQYWKYIDWMSPNYNSRKEISAKISSAFALDAWESLDIGSYIKVENGGDGRYLILERTAGTGGTFDDNWNIVYSQNGTIQFLEPLWNLSGSLYAWDQRAGFDQTQFDQSPSKEIFYAVTALKDDIFVGNLKIYWNQLFFKAVRYAMTEQKNLDWAFKTTFISVINNLGSLDQRHSYKLQNSKNYENFLKEIKPYHTKIRKFVEAYTSTEFTQSFTTDFDLPVYYNTLTFNFTNVDFGNKKLLQYPWKSWFENHTHGIESITVFDGGSGYNAVPTISIIAAANDTGYGATAIAYVALGKITDIIVTNPGNGYTVAPTVVINGGGNGALTPARVYARLGKSPVRTNTVALKFDRVTGQREIGTSTWTDSFVAIDNQVSFDLTWVPILNKADIDLYVNDTLQLYDSYTIEYRKEKFNNSYTKSYAVLKLQYIPNKFDRIRISYLKNLSFYTAVDRIEYYYQPTAGMPGKDPEQLMSGVTYDGLSIETLPFDFSNGWDMLPFGTTSWDNYSLESGYISYSTNSTSTQTFVLTDTIISTGTRVNVYLNKTRIDGTGSAIVPTIIGIGSGAIDNIEVTVSGSGYVSSLTTVTISSPNSISGTAATATAILNVLGQITGIELQNSGRGYTSTPVVTITGPSTIQAYARAVIKSEFTTTVSATTQTVITIPSSAFLTTSTLIEFRHSDSDGTLQIYDIERSLDSVINGGNMAYTTALGLTPSEIILDGGSTSTRFMTGMIDDGFLNSYNSPAPEECVPGQIMESVGISLYTQSPLVQPNIVNKLYTVNGSTSTYSLGLKPTNIDSVIAVFNNRKLNKNEYVIDFTNNTFRFTSTTPGLGALSLTSIHAGTISLIDYNVETFSAPGGKYSPPVLFDAIGSAGSSTYVTINGIPAIFGVDYSLVDNLNNPEFTFFSAGTIQSYLFSAPIKAISEITEQVYVAYTATTVISLTNPPGKLAPYHSQVIVTNNGLRLNPPVTSYYQVMNGQLVYNISESYTFKSRTIALNDLEVYINGDISTVAGIWKLNQNKNTIKFAENSLIDGDVIAIVVKKNHDYLVQDDKLILTYSTQPYDEFRITTFTNHDPNFIRTERFIGHATGEYRLQRPVLNSAYVWVSVNGKPMALGVDYTVDADGYTVVINNRIAQTQDISVVITSFADLVNTLSGYRIFRDLLGRTHYKALRGKNTAVLAENLYSTSTYIAVSYTHSLSPPNKLENRPGVILVDGERIEFFEINENRLTQIRRGTLGTSPRRVHKAGTEVIDQGTAQTLGFTDVTQTFSTSTTLSTNYYLSNFYFDDTASYTDQVEVRYQGRLLLKPGQSTIKHDFDKSYDSSELSDIVLTSQYDISTTTNILTLNFVPVIGARLDVTKRTSKQWYIGNVLQEGSDEIIDLVI